MAVTASGLIVPDHAVEAQAQDDTALIARHFSALAKLERTFPQLVKMAADLARQLQAVAARKGQPIRALILDTPKWQADGTITVAVTVDPEAKREHAGARPAAARNFQTLKEIDEDAPQAVDLAMALAGQLVNLANTKRLLPTEIGITKPRWTGEHLITFRVLQAAQGLAPGKIQL